MARRVSFSGLHLGLADIDGYHHDSEASLRLYFSSASPTYAVRFLGHSVAEVAEQLHTRLAESQLRASLTVLSSLEAAFRIDYLQRCYHRDRSDITRYTPKLGRKFDYLYLYELADEVFESFPFLGS